jgi:hypothetical protein
MDLHKALNRLAATHAEEVLAGAHVYGLLPENRPAIEAFMRGSSGGSAQEARGGQEGGQETEARRTKGKSSSGKKGDQARCHRKGERHTHKEGRQQGRTAYTQVAPRRLRTVSHLNPLTYEVDARRALMLVNGTSDYGLPLDFTGWLLPRCLRP